MRKGTGYTSPAIASGVLVYFTRQGENEVAEGRHPETGARLWQFAYPTTFEDRYGYNNGPRASPVIDGDRIYLYGAQARLHCLRLKTGEVIWKRDLAADFRLRQDFFGTATTPLVEGPNLVINTGAPGGPTVVALDKTSGKTVWTAGKEWGASYASPVAATIHGRQRILVFAGGESDPPTGGLILLDSATGQVQGTFPWRSKSYESVNAANPVVVGDRVFLTASYRTGSVLLRILPNGKLEPVWTSREFGAHWNTPVHKDGYLYFFDGRNEPDAALVCVELATGKLVWRENLEWDETVGTGAQQRTMRLGLFRGSLIQADGLTLCLGELGHLLWLDLTPREYVR